MGSEVIARQDDPALSPNRPNGTRPEFSQELPQIAAADASQLVAHLRADQCERWQRGERVIAEKYFEQHPELNLLAELAVDLVYSEFLLREELGESPQRDEYFRRFPQFEHLLARQFELHFELAGGDPTSECGGRPFDTHFGWPARSVGGAGRIGRFEIRQPLGAGGFGSVYRAFDPQLGRDVALKVPHAHLLTDEHRDRFLREARAAAQLQHPNLVAVYDAGVTDEGGYIAYQFVPGESLAESLKRRSYSPEQAVELVRKLAIAAHHAHSKGIFHRDLKTANVLLDAQGEPFISDFGLVRLEGDATLTADATVLGTPAYMSPEQALGASHTADARSDVYTLGVVLYELLTGRLPFDGPAQSVLRQVVEQDPPSLRALNDRVPRELETICLKAIAKRPAERYTSAQELADDLGRWQRHEPIVARPTPAWARAVKWACRRPAAAALLIVSVLATVVLLALGTWYNVRLHAAHLQTQRLLRQRSLLLSQHQAERGVQHLKQQDTLGLLHLLEARQLAQDIPQVREARAALWAGWFDACAGRLLQVLGGEGQTDVLAFSPNGKLLATGSGQGARLWDLESGEPRTNLLPHTSRLAVAFSHDSRLFVTAAEDEGLRVWETATGKLAERQLPAIANMSGLAVSPNGSLVAVSSGRDVWIGNLTTGELWGKPLRHDSDVGRGIEFSRDGRLLATTTRSGQRGVVSIWQLNPAASSAAAPVARQITNEQEIASLSFSPDSSLLATAGADDTAQLWDAVTGEPRCAPMRHQEDVWTVAFSKDGQLVATGSLDGTARLWDGKTGQSIAQPLRHQGPVRSLDFSPDGTVLATGSSDGTVRLWNTSNGQLHGWPLQHPGDVTSVAFQPDGMMLASASSVASARLWSVRMEQPTEQRIFPHENRVLAVAVGSNRGELLATGTSDGTAQLWDTAGANLLFGPWRHDGEVVSVAISRDGRLLAIGRATVARGLVELRDTATGDRIGDPLRADAPLRTIAFSPDGRLLAAGTIRGAIQLWDTNTRRRHGSVLRHKVSATDSEITAVAFSPDGKLLATGSMDRTVQLWKIDSAEHHCPFLWHEGRVEALAFSPDGARLATASSDLTIRFWDSATGKSLAQTVPTDAPVLSLAFSPSGRLLATASADGTAGLWDLETGLACGLPFTHAAVATTVAFSHDEKWLATGSFDRTARLWRLPQYLGDSDFDRMQLRTFVTLGVRLGTQGNIEAIPWQEWQRMRRELNR